MNDKQKLLVLFPNPNPERNYKIIHTAHEFTSVCPVTGQPDFGKITLEYIAEGLCVELKSYKLYLQSFRNDGIYFEAVTNKILNDLVELMQPRYMKITSDFNMRGGISSVIEAAYQSPTYKA